MNPNDIFATFLIRDPDAPGIRVQEILDRAQAITPSMLRGPLRLALDDWGLIRMGQSKTPELFGVRVVS